MVPSQRRASAVEKLAEVTGEPPEKFDPEEGLPVPDSEDLESVPVEEQD